MRFAFELTQKALDEFETSDLSANVRKALRIARLVGDSDYVWIFNRDLRPLGGSPDFSTKELQGIFTGLSISEINIRVTKLRDEWFKERTPVIPKALQENDGIPEDDILHQVIVDLESNYEYFMSASRQAHEPEKNLFHLRAGLDVQILERIRNRTHSYLTLLETRM